MSIEAMKQALEDLERSESALHKGRSALRQAIEQAEKQEPVAHTYASTQATNCAVCGKHKHTPLRIDAMGGYVCLTCIDNKLGSLLGEFGYPEPDTPPPRQPLSNEQRKGITAMWSKRHRNYTVGDIIDAVEAAHGIKGEA